uniref:DUF19 domain-containing protein n=1 Tax=Caenorhabditis tropicalis TaxID=1561998 RepID=A0A1I7UJB2_9PELO
MRNSLIFLVFFFILASGDLECSKKILGPKVTKCMKTLRHLIDTTTVEKPDYEKAFPGVLQDCKAIGECDALLHCVHNETLETVFKNLKINCEAAEYFISVFPKCNEKLEALNSTCLENWDPFPDTKSNVTLPEKTAEETEEAFLGKDECVKKEIVKTCGQEEWDLFNKHQRNVAMILGLIVEEKNKEREKNKGN